MRFRALGRRLAAPCRAISTEAANVRFPRPVPTLDDTSIETFRRHGFQDEDPQPSLLPPDTFAALPAISRWFRPSPDDERRGTLQLNTDYLSAYGDTIVPLEISDRSRFSRVEQPLSFFLSAASSPIRSRARIYLAQATLSDLPVQLQADVPTPKYVHDAGRGDVYGSSIWLGAAPTYTPLHRDPNPNLFVQLAGRKHVRLLPPAVGRAVYGLVQRRLGGSGSASMRGEEMMLGKEKVLLDQIVWARWDGTPEAVVDQAKMTVTGILTEALEAHLEPGDGLFIPQGWWHSVKGVGRGMNGSVNWWFR